MPFLITAYDHPDKEVEREGVRQAHREYLASFGKRLLASGALLDEAGENIIGGSSLFDTDDRDEALRFESEDPYAKAGIRADVNVVQWRLRWWVGEFNSDGHKPSEK
ncbi:YciI family protein [Tateyamaria sp.]|jgi:uncharacterized protein YciI|uniref:YciI family protein n=1 Tax=Tateyamaria sp. TaxID=1929288 RepID=UPI0032DD0574|tara:strand:- start:1006 stop:1326 length:321 start_codon:yes stop_codon:yes gene_type:complete